MPFGLVRILPGGDYGFANNPIGRNAIDIRLFVDLFGYSPPEALSAATSLAGSLMDLPVGAVKVGGLADLLLVKGDPTADVALLQDKANRRVVMKDARLHKHETRRPDNANHRGAAGTHFSLSRYLRRRASGRAARPKSRNAAA